MEYSYIDPPLLYKRIRVVLSFRFEPGRPPPRASPCRRRGAGAAGGVWRRGPSERDLPSAPQADQPGRGGPLCCPCIHLNHKVWPCATQVQASGCGVRPVVDATGVTVPAWPSNPGAGASDPAFAGCRHRVTGLKSEVVSIAEPCAQAPRACGWPALSGCRATAARMNGAAGGPQRSRQTSTPSGSCVSGKGPVFVRRAGRMHTFRV